MDERLAIARPETYGHQVEWRIDHCRSKAGAKVDHLPGPAEIKQVLRRNKWFKSLPEDIVRQLIPALKLRRFFREELVHSKHEEPTGLYCVIAGGVRASSISLEGQESVFSFWGIGGWIGLCGLLDGKSRALDIRTCDESILGILKHRDFKRLLESHPIFYKHLALLMCEVARKAVECFEDENILPLQARLAKRLVALADTYGVPHEAGILLDLHLPQEALASILHVSRATINKNLVDWQRRRLIAMRYGTIVLRRRKALESLYSGR